MPIPSPRSLVATDSSALDLSRLALYQITKERAAVAREQYAKLVRQVNSIANLYFEEFPEAHERVSRLRREIRIATRGVASDVGPDDLSRSVAISQGVTEQLHAAQKHLVKAAYRLVVSLVHPDRSKYDAALFQQVQRAYEHNDLTFLQELYFTIHKEPNLFWRQREGIEFWQQEIERPTVSLRVLQATPEFQICRAHMSGRTVEARECARARLAELAFELWSELCSLSMEHHYRGDETPDPTRKGAGCASS
jgi:hypothetical protein